MEQFIDDEEDDIESDGILVQGLVLVDFVDSEGCNCGIKNVNKYEEI